MSARCMWQTALNFRFIVSFDNMQSEKKYVGMKRTVLV
jgi:hypothetical protein